MIENIDCGTASSHKGDMQGRARLRALTDPEGWFAALEVGCLPGGTKGNGGAMAGLLRRHFHDDAVAKRGQCL